MLKQIMWKCAKDERQEMNSTGCLSHASTSAAAVAPKPLRMAEPGCHTSRRRQ